MSVERIEMLKLAGRLLDVVNYLDKLMVLRQMENAVVPIGLSWIAYDVRAVRKRLIELGETLTEGPLEAFAREHPLYEDPIDGPYCGYGAAEGKPYTCPVHDPALHWDAWELLGTQYVRPEQATRRAE